VGFANSAILDEAEPLTLRVFEIKSQPAVAFADVSVTHITVPKSVHPPAKASFPGHTQSGAHDTVGAPLFRWGRPVEEGQIGAWAPLPVGIEKMVSRDIILIHSLLDQTHPQDVGVEGIVRSGVRCNRSEMVNAVKIHQIPYTMSSWIADTTGELRIHGLQQRPGNQDKSSLA
jgi:hypothetical protein